MPKAQPNLRFISLRTHAVEILGKVSESIPEGVEIFLRIDCLSRSISQSTFLRL